MVSRAHNMYKSGLDPIDCNSSFRFKNSINILMIFDQIGGSFELAEQVGEIFFFYLFGYLPKFKYSSFYCLLVVLIIELVQ